MLTSPNTTHVAPGENNAFDDLRPLETIMPLLDNLLDVEVPFDKVAEQAIICLEKIGNTRRSRYAVEVSVEDGFAELPPNCEQVDAVLIANPVLNTSFLGLSSIVGAVYNPTDGDFLTNENNGISNLKLAVAPDQVAGLRRSLHLGNGAAIDLGQYGERYQNYTFRDGGLYVGRQASASELVRQASRMGCEVGEVEAEGPQTLRVFYRGQVSDERGYPLITPSEALACAYFTNFIVMYKKYNAKQATLDQKNEAEKLYNQHVNQARVSPLASSNAMDRLLDEDTRYHRHHFGDNFSVR